jgi:hypothetical protein
VEGFLIDRKGRSVKNGDGVDVVPAKIDINSGYVELNPVSKEKNG